MALNPGEVEVIVIQDTTFNGPDHRTLGPLKAGDTVTTAAGLYADWLVEHGFAAYPGDFTPDVPNPDLQDLDALIAAAEEQAGAESDAALAEMAEETEEPADKPVAKKPGPKKKVA